MDAPTATLIVGLTTTVINLVGIGLNIYFTNQAKNKDLRLAQNLKELEPKINSLKLREEKRIVIYESIFDKMTSMSLFTQGDEQNLLINMISELDALVNQKRLYVYNKDFTLIQRYNDYFRTLLTNPRAKDFANERLMLQEFVDNFNG